MMARPISRLRVLASMGMLLLIWICAGLPASADVPYAVVIAPDNSFNFWVLKDGAPLAAFRMGGWGPNWGWNAPPTSNAKGASGQLRATGQFKAGSLPIDVTLDAAVGGAQSVRFQYNLSASGNVPLTMLMSGLSLQGDRVKSVTARSNGQDVSLAIPFVRAEQLAQVSQLTFHLADGDITEQFDPPITVGRETNETRLELAAGTLKAGHSATTVTLSFPAAVSFLSSSEETGRYVKTVPDSTWFTLAPTLAGPSIFDMADWLEKPAGNHGGVRMVGDQFKFEDGTPIKFWGVNLSYSESSPEKPLAEAMAARFARYGVNSVRLHKFTGVGWAGVGDPKDATKFEPQGLDRFDYFTAQLKSRGIYYGFSHTYHFQVRPANKRQLLAYDEIVKNLNGDTYGLINYAEDVQDLLIQSVVNMLKHQNPYTQRIYAQDPALAYVELQNEDDIFFYTTDAVFQKCPTYAKNLTERFSDWLRQRYGSQDKLAAVWGGALRDDETLAARNIRVQPNPWVYSEDQLPKATGGGRQRLLDNALFFHEVQDKFYTRFVKAIRDTGYAGPLVGSPWQAPAMVPHYYNLLSDDEVGYIDRHGYFGGGRVDATMLKEPGSGYLSTGLQQVADQPFGLSEWIHEYPSLYSAEGLAIIAAYGLGLQDWDASYEFTSSPIATAFMPVINRTWPVDVPNQFGLYPALTRMVYRHDVQPGDVISTRRVSPPEIEAGTFNFSDKIVLNGDEKSFGGSVPPEALAAGRCLVQFTNQPQASDFPDMTKYEKDGVITSSTGQLAWNRSEQGFFIINTAGTKGLVGFAAEKPQALGDVSITSHSPYAVVLLTALEKEKTLADSGTALITAVSRVSNTDFAYDSLSGAVVNPGHAPILVEPVVADFALSGRTIKVVNILDADGRETGRSLEMNGGSFRVDTGRDKTIYYEVVFY